MILSRTRGPVALPLRCEPKTGSVNARLLFPLPQLLYLNF